MAKVWIEAALNGPWTREKQPGIPVAVEDIVADGIAAANAGAAIVHAHAYDVTTGRQKDDWEIYARIIEGIRANVDVIVYPTIPSPALGQEQTTNRFGHTLELAKRGLIEWAVIDPGSVHFARFDDLGQGGIYQNPHADILEGMRIARAYNVHPSYAIYEPGFTRLGAALADIAPVSPTPIYRFMFSDEFAWGFPPRAKYLDAHLALLGDIAAGAPWMIAGLGVDIDPLISDAVARGGHVRVGLEDARWGCGLSNETLVKNAVRLVRSAGGEPASVGDVRTALRAMDDARGRVRT
ncbi:MAG: 3-keto-5-aminohexanoate cleavage protein [Afipia sp.]|nr:3-keto-5-aminohexanoate cleavage protein [Afipia sp.]